MSKRKRIDQLERAVEQTCMELRMAQLNEETGVVRTTPSRAMLMREDLEGVLAANRTRWNPHLPLRYALKHGPLAFLGVLVGRLTP